MMESSKIFGGGYEEECQSSESGWTMYIGSPVHGDDYADNHDNDDDDDDDGNDDDDDSDANHDDESDDDDSMASDASSGPNNLGRTHGNGSETGHGFGVALKHDHEDEEDHGDGKYSCFGNKAKEPVTKLQRKEGKKEEMVFMQGRKAKAPVHQSGAKKVIKNILMGKRK